MDLFQSPIFNPIDLFPKICSPGFIPLDLFTWIRFPGFVFLDLFVRICPLILFLHIHIFLIVRQMNANTMRYLLQLISMEYG